VEISAVEETFSGCFVYLCDFHLEQAWVRWVAATKNGVRQHREEVLSRLRRAARASTVEKYQEADKGLKECTLYKEHASLQRFTTQWEPVHKRWVWAFRMDRLNYRLNTNNGLERQNRTFKHTYLKEYKDNTLSGLTSVIINVFLPEQYRVYVLECPCE
jgi:hypothetical protein